jgi:c-di-GMP-binding flagellar brake protein YcgR
MLRPGIEHRRSPRIPLQRFIVCLRAGDRIVTGDLSSGGIGFEVPEPIHLGDPIAVSLTLPETGESVSLSAVICHVTQTDKGTYRIGARFIDMDVLIQRPLERYVEETALESKSPIFA